jgi:nucleoside-diphosphate-sugar epimerase
MDILITGGTGLLGHHLVPALQQRGENIRVLTLPAEDARWLEASGVTVYRGNILQPETLAAPMRCADAVLHLAALMGAWQPIETYRAINVTGTQNVCRAALAAGVRRLVHVSSWSVYGMGISDPAREDFILRPFPEPYAITKAEGDLAVQEMIVKHGLPAVIVRPGTFFGPGDFLHFGRVADRIRDGRAIIVGPGNNALPFVYVTDVVQGLLLALYHEEAVGQAYNITNDQPMTQQQFLTAIASEIGARSPRVHVPYHALYAAACIAERFAAFGGPSRQPVVTRLAVKLFGTDNRHSIDKARHELGYKPEVTLREGVHLSARWYLKRGERNSLPSAAR